MQCLPFTVVNQELIRIAQLASFTEPSCSSFPSVDGFRLRGSRLGDQTFSVRRDPECRRISTMCASGRTVSG